MQISVPTVPDLLSSTAFARVTARVKSDLDRAALEAVTGRRQDAVLAAKGQLGQVARVSRLAQTADVAGTRLALATGRFEHADAALRTARRSVDETRLSAMTAADAGEGALAEAAEAGRQSLSAVMGMLNTSFDGRALFAGAAAGARALGTPEAVMTGAKAAMAGATDATTARAALDAYFAPGGGYETEVYGGATEDAAPIMLPDGSTLAPMPRADAEGVKEMLQGLVMLASYVDLPPLERQSWIDQATALMGAGSEKMVAAEAVIGASIGRLDGARERLAEDTLTANRTLDRIVGRDAFEAASETQALEQRLQAAYTLTSRMSRLSLTDYLR